MRVTTTATTPPPRHTASTASPTVGGTGMAMVTRMAMATGVAMLLTDVIGADSRRPEPGVRGAERGHPPDYTRKRFARFSSFDPSLLQE